MTRPGPCPIIRYPIDDPSTEVTAEIKPIDMIIP
jgi:hypothetical protein